MVSHQEKLELWMGREVEAALEHVEVRVERRRDGRVWGYATGAKTIGHSWVTASLAKPVHVAAILDRVAAGDLALDSLAADLIPGYAANATGDQLDVSLRHCLSFTSGLSAYDTEQTWKAADWSGYLDRVAVLPAVNAEVTPGTTHVYSTVHLDLACAMAVEASEHDDWTSLFDAWRAKTGVAPGATYNGGFIACAAVQLEDMTTAAYAAFMRALRDGRLLPASLTAAMRADQIPSITEPTRAFDWVGEDWHFGYCLWLEQLGASWASGTPTGRVSTVGTSGQYAYADPRHTLVVSHVGGQADPKVGLGVALARRLAPYLRAWELLPR